MQTSASVFLAKARSGWRAPCVLDREHLHFADDSGLADRLTNIVTTHHPLRRRLVFERQGQPDVVRVGRRLKDVCALAACRLPQQSLPDSTGGGHTTQWFPAVSFGMRVLQLRRTETLLRFVRACHLS